MKRRAEERKNGAREGTEAGAIRGLESRTEQLRLPIRERQRQKRCSRSEPRAERPGRTSRTFRKRAMYESLMEEAVTDENLAQAPATGTQRATSR